jgi:protein gp37
MKHTNIQWSHSTLNPVMGCDGCELWLPPGAICALLASFIAIGHPNDPNVRRTVDRVVGERQTSELYRDREAIVDELVLALNCQLFREELVDIIRKACPCYAGLLGTMRAGHKGYADSFEIPKLFPRRMAAAANWGLPTPAETEDKPWLEGMLRLIFISDMGDALSADVPFEFIRQEIITNVTSEKGQRHVWLWLSKRPARMAEFGGWLHGHGHAWPDNLVAMTTVTSQRYASRVDALRRVPSKLKGLSIEPLFENLNLNLEGIVWLIVGGGSDSLANVFEVEWALNLRRACEENGIAFFFKQLGRRPLFNGKPLLLADGHGGDWGEWRKAWRTRELPAAFKEVVTDAQPSCR